MSDTPVFTVFTPSHKVRFLDDCYASLTAQTFTDWEWVVLLNGKAQWKPPADDPRVRVITDTSVKGVGAAKRVACAAARGDILVELDHDDVLVSTCLELLQLVFSGYPQIGFVYSSWAQITEAGGRDDTRFNESNGWVYEDVEVDGRSVLMCHALAPTPHNLSYIWFAPNHVRAFRRSTYEEVGGYDPARDILDDQDLMCRLYQAADFALIDECLYLQRMHADNTQRVSDLNQRIQRETIALYDAYIEPCARAWSQRAGLHVLDLGGDDPTPEGYTRIDDLVDGLLEYADGSVGLIRANDVLPFVTDRVRLFNEIFRVLADSGMFLSLTPSTDGRAAFQDPRYVSYWNENSFWYFTDETFVAKLPEADYRFQSSRLVTYAPNGEWGEQRNITYVSANLIALKGGSRNGGVLTS